MREKLRRWGVLHEMTQAHHRDAVAELDRLIDVVSDEDDGYALGALQAEELVLETLAHDRVDRREGLVHEHQRRLGRHRPRDADALALAARELRGIAAAHALGIEADEPHELVDARLDALLRPAQKARDGRDVLGDGLMREESGLLDHIADPPAKLRRIICEHVLPVDQDLARARLDESVHHPERCGFAASGWAHEDTDASRRDGEAQAVDRDGVAVTLGDLAQLDRGAGALGHAPRIKTLSRHGTAGRT